MAVVCVLAPSPALTITVERSEQGEDEIHLHAGGQGFWIARLAHELDAEVTMCTTLGGETGEVLARLLETHGLPYRSVPSVGANGSYVHDRRSGERVEIATMPPPPLSRHEVDELYGAALVEGLKADVTVLAGAGPWTDVIPESVYRRLAADLRRHDVTVVADLSGELLEQACEGGLSVVKVSHEELLRDGLAADDSIEGLAKGMWQLSKQSGGAKVVCSRADEPALALADGELLRIDQPTVEPLDPKGAGDSFTAGLSTGLARGQSFEDALRLAAAAGSLNATRRGLGSGRRDQIEDLAEQVQIERMET